MSSHPGLEDDLVLSADEMTDTDELRLVERVADRLGVVIRPR
jgi:hypothetical protein